MALVVREERHKNTWSNRDKQAVRHKIPDTVEKPVIDYDKLKALCEIEGLKNRQNDSTSEMGHKHFMDNYKSMFVRPEPKKGLPTHSLERSTAKAASSGSLHSKSAGGKTLSELKKSKKIQYPVDSLTHDIRDYLPLLHKGKSTTKNETINIEHLKIVRKIARKLPFDRTADENDELYLVLKTVPDLTSQVSQEVLKELCVFAVLDEWKEHDITVFGNTGWHMILKGSAKPQTIPYQKPLGQNIDFPCPTPELPPIVPVLKPGDCFGTLEKIEGREDNSKVLTVITREMNCEFLKISCKNYLRVIERMKERDRTEKVNLLQACKTFNGWSGQPLISVADLIQWTKYPANTVLVSEGYKAPSIGIIKSGTCHVLRQVEIRHKLANGEEEKKSKQVVMGKLGANDSFGEISVITQEPITCSIITADSVDMAVIDAEGIEQLDETTKQLLLHSSAPTYSHLSQKDIHEEYVHQELKREWNEFKHSVVVDVINSKGIRPGYGKWSK